MQERRFKTNVWLWAGLSLAFFILTGFVDVTPGVKEPTNLWTPVLEFLRGDYYCSASEMLGKITVQVAIRAIPAALLGWVVHGLVVAVISIFRQPSSSAT